MPLDRIHGETARYFLSGSSRPFRSAGPFTFVVISDTHAQEEWFRYVADALANESGVLFILDGRDYAVVSIFFKGKLVAMPGVA